MPPDFQPQIIQPDPTAPAEAPQLDAPPAPEQQQQQDPALDNPTLLAELDRDKISALIVKLSTNDLADRDAFGWATMRQYDQLAYDGYKQAATTPWTNASNYSVCMTSTLLDTGHANVVGSMFANRDKVVDVEGIGPEDIRTEHALESLLNWQVLNDIDDAYDTVDKTVHCGFKHGNACIKVIQGYGPQKSKVLWSRVPIENILLPVDAKGAQVKQTDHIFEVIPLTENDKIARENLKGPDGKPVYDGIEEIQKGNRVYNNSTLDALMNTKDATSGTSLGTRFSRDMYYIMECYLTYFHERPNGDKIPVELIVWMAPQGGKILRIAINDAIDDMTGDAMRPYSTRWIPYPRDDRFYGDSLPWLVKQTQEELDYAHNQNMNAADELIRPPKFYDPNAGFDPETVEQVPNGWYPVQDPGRNVYIPTFNFNPIFERSFERYWEYAQRRTGFTELFQGRKPDREITLGEANLRVNKTEIRFKMIYERFEQGFRELMNLTYFYDRLFMPKETKVKVLGTMDYQKIEELFPQGMSGRYNFRFTSLPITEKARQVQNMREFYGVAAVNPLVATNPANQWKLLNLYADTLDIRNLEAYISKPKEANILSPQEAIQRIMSGQFDVVPDPGIDAADYMLRLAAFQKTDAFADADNDTKAAILLLQRRVSMIMMGQNLATHDAMLLQHAAAAQGGMGMQGMQGQQPGGIQQQMPPQGAPPRGV